MAAAAMFNFGKKYQRSGLDRYFAPNFMAICIMAMRKRPRDQKSKPEVNSRDVIK